MPRHNVTREKGYSLLSAVGAIFYRKKIFSGVYLLKLYKLTLEKGLSKICLAKELFLAIFCR